MVSPKLRVMFVVNRLVMGGAERQLVELARGMDKAAFEVHVVTVDDDGALDDELRAEASVRLTSLRRSSKLDPGAIRRLASMLRSEHVDILQPFLTPATFYALAAGLMARTPMLILTERSGARIQRRKAGNQAFRATERLMGRFATAAVANSEAGRDLLVSRGVPVEKTRVIYNGINPQRLQPLRSATAVRGELGIAPEALVAGIVGRLDPAKDHGTLLHALKIAHASVPGLVLLIVGDGRLRTELEQLSSELGLASDVRFLGNREDVATLIGAMDVAVLSSSDSEGSSNFLLEAMGQGKPVVATDIGGNREVVIDGRTGILVPPSTPQALATALVNVLEDPARRRALGDAALDDFERRFTLRRMVADYEDLYRALAESKGLRAREGRHAAAA